MSEQQRRSSEMVRYTERGVSIDNLADAWQFSLAVYKSGLAPRGLDSPEKVLVAIQTGLEAGLTPMASLRGLYVVNGFPQWKSEAAMALVRKSGMLDRIVREDIKDKDGNPVACRVTTKRKDSPDPVVGEYTMKEAIRAGLVKPQSNWEKFPERMLYARALGYSLRDNFPEVLMGLGCEGDGLENHEHQTPVVKDVEGSVIPSKALPPAAPDPLMQQLEQDIEAREKGEPLAEVAAADPSQPMPEEEPEPETTEATVEGAEASVDLPDSFVGLDELVQLYHDDPVYLEMVRTWDWTALENAFRKHVKSDPPKNYTAGQMAACILRAKKAEPGRKEAETTRQKSDHKAETRTAAPEPKRKRGRPKKNNSSKTQCPVQAPTQEQWNAMDPAARCAALASGIEDLDDEKVLRERAREALAQVPGEKLPETLAGLMMETVAEVENVGRLHLRRIINAALACLQEDAAEGNP